MYYFFKVSSHFQKNQDTQKLSFKFMLFFIYSLLFKLLYIFKKIIKKYIKPKIIEYHIKQWQKEKKNLA